MTFKLTYSTMFNPPEEMHERFESALAAGAGRSLARLTRCTSTGGTSAAARTRPTRQPDRSSACGWASSRWATRPTWTARWRRPGGPSTRGGATPAAERLALVRRVADLIEERVYDDRRRRSRSRSARTGWKRSARRRRPPTSSPDYADEFERNGGYDHALPDDPLDGWASHNRSVLQAARRVGGHRAVQLPAGAGRRADGGGARHRQHRRPQGRERHAVGRAPAGRLHPRRRRPARRLQLPDRERRGRRRGADPPSATWPASRSPARSTSAWDSSARSRPGRWPRPCIAEMGGKNPCIVTAHGDLERAATGIVRSAYGMGGQKCSALSRVYVDRVGRGRAARADRRADRRRSASAIPRGARTGMGPVISRTARRELRRATAATCGRAARGSSPAARGSQTATWRTATSSRRRWPRRRPTTRCSRRRCSCPS